MQLTGGGSYLNLQKQPAGTVTRGAFVQFSQDIKGLYGLQDILTLDVNGETKKIGCPTALGRVFRANRVEPGTVLDITYEGKRHNQKTDKTFHSFKVEVVDKPGSTSFPPASGGEDEEAALLRQLAEARARKAA